MKKGEDFVGVSVVFICHDGEGNYVLHKRSKNCRDEQDRWDCGGGGIELGDTTEDTLRKEIAEEFCTDVLDAQFMGFRDVHREHEGKKTHWIALDYKALVDRSKVKIGEPHKFDDLQWFKIEDFPHPQHSQVPFFLEKYKDIL